ncbi:AAA family ATPase, partial [Vibrio xuii]
MEDKFILNLIDVALKGDKSTAQMIVRKLASKVRLDSPSLYEQINKKLATDALRSSNVRRLPLPVDADSRQSLIKVEEPVSLLKEPIYSKDGSEAFEQ